MAGNHNSGRRSRPTKLKLLHGEEHEKRINRDEPQPRQVDPVPPKDISKDVRDVWEATVVELRAMGLAFAADAAALHCYCEAVVNHRKASYILARSPLMLKSRYNTWMKNPALQVQRDAAYVIRQFAHEFGLTPAARAGINTKGLGDAEVDDNPFAGFGG